MRNLHTKLLYLATAIIALALSLASTAPAQTVTPSEATPTPHIQYESYKLPNGLQVILVPDHKVPSVHLNLWYHVGSKNEPADRTGFAHLFEHMMYEGSKDAPGHYMTLLGKVGGSGNATTTADYTEYFETVPAGSLEYALWLESDRLATLPQAITQERLQNQIAVVENERRQRMENQPYGLLDVYLHENLYPAGHPYAHSVLGTHDHVRAATVNEVKDFFTTYYASNNLSMVLAGDFDTAQAKQWITKYFGPIPPALPIARPARWTTHLQGEKIVDTNDHIAEERLYLAWPTPAYLSPDSVRLQLVRMILNRRLSADLVYSEKHPCSEEDASSSADEDVSNFTVEATARPGVSLDEVEAKIDAAIALLAKDGPKPGELEAARNRYQFGELSTFDTLQSTAEALNKGQTFAGKPSDYLQRWAQIAKITDDDIKSATRQWLDTKNRVLIRFHPELAQAQNVAALDRSVAPEVHTDPPLVAPKVESAILPNGLEIYVARRTGIPKVSVLLTTRAGDRFNPKGKDGLAVVTAVTMGRTTTRSATQVRDGMESLGASTIGSGVTNEKASLNFDVLSKNIDPAFAIFSDVLAHPSFIQYSVDTNVKLWESSVAQSRDDAGAMATSAAPVILFGQDHPYAHPIATREGLESLHPDDLRNFYQTYWKPDDSALFFAGDITLEQATALATKYLGEWSGHAPHFDSVPAFQPQGAGRVYLIDKPDAAQTFITQMLPAAGTNSAERFPLYMVASVWGGMSNSRLTKLRESDGYTYGFSSGLSLFVNGGELTASGSVQTDKTKEAIVELENQLRLLAGKQPITETELADARKQSRRDDAAAFETLNATAAVMGTLWELHLPMTAMQTESDAAVEASLAQVRAAAAHFANPQKAVLLLVGDRRKIEPGLHDLHLGSITLLDADGNVIQP
jgi:zinc protease